MRIRVSPPLQILIAVGWRSAFERDVRAGAQRHFVQSRHWVAMSMNDPNLQLMKRWKPDGALAYLTDPAMARGLEHLKIPSVDTAGFIPNANHALVGIDYDAVVEMARDHFLRRGLRHFAVGNSPTRFTLIQDAFARSLASIGHELHRQPARPANDRWGLHNHRNVVQWLVQLPKPVGLLALSDSGGHWILGLCHLTGISVPEEISVLGIGNDELICQSSYPPQSSIRLPGEKIGLEAARLLERLMKGKRPPRQPLLFEPEGISVRQSSDIQAIDAPQVAEARRFIQTHLGQAISVEQIAEAVSMERRTLERRFRSALGYTILEEIHHARIERAKELLLATELSVDRIARAAGLRDAKQLRRLFHGGGVPTPTSFRRNMRPQ